MKNKEIISIFEEITERLKKKGLTISTMESCTGGFISYLLTNADGASNTLKGAYVTYSNEAKIKNGVPKEIIDEYTVYSMETAEAMANACKNQYNADIGVGITGLIGKLDPSNEHDGIGDVWVACINKDEYVVEEHFRVKGDKSRAKKKIDVASKVADCIIKIMKEM